MELPKEDDISSLERARQRLYKLSGAERIRPNLAASGERTLPHQWGDTTLEHAVHRGKKHVRLASIFFGVAALFFVAALGVAGYFIYFGNNTVSTDKISVDIQGPTNISGGDTVPLSLTVTNKNPVAIENATIDIEFPNGTRDAANVLQPYPHYIENVGPIASGATVARSIKAVVFGSSGQGVSLPVSVSFGTAGSNAVFVKKSTYPLTISTTPLSVSVETPAETVSGQPLTLTLIVRSNANIPLDNVILSGNFPFGFAVTSSSIPLTNSSFLLGKIAPGASSRITLTGTLSGQDSEQRVFHFTVGTGKSANDQTLAVPYMTQDATVAIAAPFISTTLAINGDTSSNVVMTPGSRQNVTLSYSNTLPTTVTNATVGVTISGSAVDYGSIQASSGFYRSSDHTVLFSPDTDPSLASLSPGATGIGSFTFSTLPASAASSPTVTFSVSVSGTRVGQTNVPQQVSASTVKTAKVITAIVLSSSSHRLGTIVNSGPIPPRANQATTYTVVWNAQNKGSMIADGVVTATLPSYVTYTKQTSGSGTFSYDAASRTVSWNTGDLSQGANVQGGFQVSITPSTSQVGAAPALTSVASFTGYDRFAGVKVSATADPATTETTGDAGYVSANSIVVQ
jgi:hypothetical protein